MGTAKDGWTTRRRERFLDHLAAIGNVEVAVAEIGLSKQSVYALRRRDPKFAYAWRQALLAGYDRLEEAVIRRALGEREHAPVVDGAATGAAPRRGEVDIDLALLLLSRHRPTVAKAAKEIEDGAFRMSRDAAEKTLITKLKALKKRIDAKQAGGDAA